jgi:NitT/TauT family transport system substrate-binding protein
MPRRNRHRVTTAALLTLCLALTACGGAEPADLAAEADASAPAAGVEPPAAPTDDGEPSTVRMQLSWIPDCQFAGYLAADEQGFYEEQGLDVELLPGGPNVNAIQQVVTGAADFTVGKVASLFAARDQGLPIVAVAQFDKESSFPLVAYADEGISEPADLKGKKVGIWYDGDEYEVLALLAQAGLDPESDVELFEQGFTMDPFLNREYDVAMVTSFNELNVLHLEGVGADELTVINPSDYGISIPHGALMANEQWLADNADAAARFVSATLEGWRYAFDNPEDTATTCAESSLAAGGEAATSKLEELQSRMIATMEELQLPEGTSESDQGRIDPELYQSVADIVHEFGLIDEPADVDSSYDPTVLESATGS